MDGNLNNLASLNAKNSTKESMVAYREKCIQKHASGECLSLDETAYAIWDPAHEDKPMTPMGILKIERKALAKLKLKLKENGISSLDDVFDPRHREFAKQENSREW